MKNDIYLLSTLLKTKILETNHFLYTLDNFYFIDLNLAS